MAPVDSTPGSSLFEPLERLLIVVNLLRWALRSWQFDNKMSLAQTFVLMAASCTHRAQEMREAAQCERRSIAPTN